MGNDVKRYSYGFHSDGFGEGRTLGLIEKEDGNLVRFEDYAALEAECERLRAELEQQTEQNARLARGARIARMLSEYLDGRMVFTRLAEINEAIAGGEQNDC